MGQHDFLTVVYKSETEADAAWAEWPAEQAETGSRPTMPDT